MSKSKGYEGKNFLQKAWYFIWEDNSPLSWIVNIILAFILIKFVVYPGLGLILGTEFPIVAVVSSSMEHQGSFDEWWESSVSDYHKFGITKEEFEDYPLKNGFNKGDIIILRGVNRENLKKGDIVVFKSGRPDPIIHRVVYGFNSGNFIQTKGDNFESNRNQIIHYVNLAGQSVPKGTPNSIKVIDETEIREQDLIGKAWIRIPWLGYVKIIFVELFN